MDTRETITLDDTAQQRLTILTHLLADDLTNKVVGRLMLRIAVPTPGVSGDIYPSARQQRREHGTPNG